MTDYLSIENGHGDHIPNAEVIYYYETGVEHGGRKELGGEPFPLDDIMTITQFVRNTFPDGWIRYNDKVQPMWRKSPPDGIGYWWFFGWTSQFGKEHGHPKLYLVNVFQGSNSIVMTTEGQYIYKSETEGIWFRTNVPDQSYALESLEKISKNSQWLDDYKEELE